MARRLSVAELRDLFEHGAKREDLNRIRQIEDVFLNESTTQPERKQEDIPPVVQVTEEEEEEEEEQFNSERHQVIGQDDDHEDEVEKSESILQVQNFSFNQDRDLYQVVFDVDCNEGLGMVVQQQDEEIPGTNRVRERLVIEMITESGAASRKGITEGSVLVKVNGIEVVDKSYSEALSLLKQHTRPLVLEFERGLGIYTTQGYCFKAATGSVNPPKRFNAWKLRYFVLGGPVAGSNVLQLYKSKSDFDKVVVSVVSRRPVTQKFKVYLLTTDYYVSLVKQKRYDLKPAPLDFFCIRRPGARFNKVMHIARIPSDSSDSVRTLHAQISEMTTLEP
jgi:hypothetical protein